MWDISDPAKLIDALGFPYDLTDQLQPDTHQNTASTCNLGSQLEIYRGGDESKDENASTDSGEWDIAEDDLDDINEGRHYLDDHAFQTFFEDNNKAIAAKRIVAEHRRQEKEQRKSSEYEDLTSLEAFKEVLEFECPCCETNCATRGFSIAVIERQRLQVAARVLGNGERGQYVTDLIVNSSTTSATHGANKRRRSDGGEPRANKIHYVIDGIDICSDFFACVLGISPTMTKTASADARGQLAGRERPPRRTTLVLPTGATAGTMAEHEAFDTPAVLLATAWLISHSRFSGAELLPHAEYSKFSTVDEMIDMVHGASYGNGLEMQYACRVPFFDC